jgi:hypothetical protein
VCVCLQRVENGEPAEKERKQDSIEANASIVNTGAQDDIVFSHQMHKKKPKKKKKGKSI